MKEKTILDNPSFTKIMILLSILQFINLYTENSINCLGVFGIIYFISTYFSKNKGVCLLMALIFSSVGLGCNIKEGLLNPIAGCGENITPTWVGDLKKNKKTDKLLKEKTNCENVIKIEESKPINAMDITKKKAQDKLVADYKERLAYIKRALK